MNKSRSVLVLNTVALLALLLAGWWSRNYYVQFFRGPLPVHSDEQLLDIAKGVRATGRIAYVELKDRRLLPTDFEAVGTRNGKQYAANPYFLVAVQDQFLLVLATFESDGAQLIGPLQVVSGPVDREVWQSLQMDRPELRDRLLPLVLNAAAAFNVIGYLGLIAGIPLSLLLLRNIVKHLASPR